MRVEAAASATVARAFRWTGALIFAASLAYFFHQYLTRFGTVTVDGNGPAAIAWNGLLFTAFALHHSVFAREPVRRWIRRRLPPGLERSLYVWVASLCFIAVCALWRPVPGLAWEAAGAAVWLLRGVQTAGVWLTLRSAAILDVRVLAGIASEGAPESGSADERPGGESPFKTTGPYGWVRHPIYSAWFLVVFFVSPMTVTRLVFAVISSAYLLIAIPLEERTMRATSRGAYDQYMRVVRWRLLPGVY